MNPLDAKEPLLQPLKNDKYVFTSSLSENKDIFDLYNIQQSAFWTAGEIDMADDKLAFEKLDEGSQRFISHVLAFFASSDLIVNENICTRFIEDIEIPIIRACYTWQMAMEDVHSQTYSLLLQTIIPDNKKRYKLTHAITEIDAIKAKADFCMKYMGCDCQFKYRLIAFAICEGVFFSASFASIYWLKSKGIKMNGLITSNEFISRDEGMHCQMACLLYAKLLHPLSETQIHGMFRKGCEIEQAFIKNAIPSPILGMNSTTMCQYVEFVCDYWLKTLGYSALFGSENPYQFMEMLSLETKANFFEAQVSNYSKAEKAHIFDCEDDDF